MSDEKRIHKRVSVNAIVIYQLKDPVALIKSKLKRIGTPIGVNISEGGLQIITSQKIPSETPLKIDLSILPTKIPIEVFGKVKWTKPDSKQGQYKSGVEFTQFIQPDHKELIRKYIHSRA